MRTNRLLGTAAVIAALLLAAGCGGEDEGADAEQTGALSKAEYISEGDRICAEGTAEMAREAVDRFGNQQPTREEAETFGQEVVVPTLGEQLAQLRALPAPSGDSGRVEAIYDAVERGITELRDDPSLLTRPATGGAFDEANRLAERYGFRQCGSA